LSLSLSPQPMIAAEPANTLKAMSRESSFFTTSHPFE
jgi:hypothetical protein